ncbi:glycosyl transferase family 1 [Clostridium zeae]|uniref:Glycosyl transferase family 1 n=1 Tax=Clostridium zeae TaxID=2759022 RepID=A0ABQ1E5F5_9CLOT|nr:glycosyltransferase family 4 protein [Clostridium zeae]GFZ29964.1 glycosyl transferase family 1 [Clostridium zeae]
MNIGLFTDTYYPQINGVATSVLMLKEYLENIGHKVYVFTTTDPKVVGWEKNVYRVPSIPFASARRVGLFYNPRLAKVIKRLNLDLIHTHTEFSLGIFGRAMARELNIPFLHTYHTIYEDYTHYIVKLKIFDPIAKIAARRLSVSFCNSADQVIVPTKKVLDMLESYNVQKDISVIPTGIEINKFSRVNYNFDTAQSLRKSLGINTKDKVLLYVGRISKEKNIEEIMINLKGYLKSNRDVKLVLIGDGPDKHRLETIANALNINDQVVFAGERPWDDIGRYYQIGDVFVSASQSETQGLTYIEALAAGLPVIAKADKCLDGVIENYVNGYLFNDTEDFIEALNLIIFNDLKKKQLSLEAIKTARRFSAEGFAESVEQLYKTMDIYKVYEEVSI